MGLWWEDSSSGEGAAHIVPAERGADPRLWMVLPTLRVGSLEKPPRPQVLGESRLVEVTVVISHHT